MALLHVFISINAEHWSFAQGPPLKKFFLKILNKELSWTSWASNRLESVIAAGCRPCRVVAYPTCMGDKLR